MPVTTSCKTCGKTLVIPPSKFRANGNYCSMECTKKRVTYTCEFCGESFERPASSLIHHTNKYCSNACRYEGRKTNPVDTILRKIDRSGGPDACWPFMGTRLPKGYGSIRALGHHWYAHRVVYEAMVEVIPEGMVVCHKCDNPPCCNPAHLFVGTIADNMQDMIRKGRSKYGGKKVA